MLSKTAERPLVNSRGDIALAVRQRVSLHKQSNSLHVIYFEEGGSWPKGLIRGRIFLLHV